MGFLRVKRWQTRRADRCRVTETQRLQRATTRLLQGVATWISPTHHRLPCAGEPYEWSPCGTQRVMGLQVPQHVNLQIQRVSFLDPHYHYFTCCFILYNFSVTFPSVSHLPLEQKWAKIRDARHPLQSKIQMLVCVLFGSISQTDTPLYDISLGHCVREVSVRREQHLDQLPLP